MNPIPILRRPPLADTLRKYREEIADLDALVYAAHRLTDSVCITGDEEDMADADESLSAACALLRIGMRTLRYLRADLDDEIARAGMTDNEEPPPSTPSASA